MGPEKFEIFATVIFACAVLHTFSVKLFQHWARQFPEGSILENLCHLLGEIEIVFGLWAGLLVATIAIVQGGTSAAHLIDRTNFSEPAFVFVIMAMTATRPILEFAGGVIDAVAKVIPLERRAAFFLATLTIGPLLGSFITEPAAMTVTALLIKDRVFSQKASVRLMYLTLGVLFVNVSIGGTLTPFAAPPVLMVASIWKWDLGYMASHFGWKAALAILLNAGIVTALHYPEFRQTSSGAGEPGPARTPFWLQAVHIFFLVLVVLTAHYPSFFLGIFLFFLGMATITREYQDELELRQALLVGFFLAGLVVLGGFQSWWLEPLIRRLDALALFLGATGLTAFADNAALTYLGAQVPNVSESFQYALVAGAVAGGGLTVIANAPNPAGYSILSPNFGPEGISPGRLFLGALGPTLVAMGCLWWLP